MPAPNNVSSRTRTNQALFGTRATRALFGTDARRARLVADRHILLHEMRFLRYIEDINRSAMVFEEEMYDRLGDETYYSQPEQQQQQQQEEEEGEGDRDEDDEEEEHDHGDDDDEFPGDRREILRLQICRLRDELRDQRDQWHRESEALIEERGRELAARFLPLVVRESAVRDEPLEEQQQHEEEQEQSE